jgi:signal transduction histidine kinase
MLFRPLDRLVQKAEAYSPEQGQTLFALGEEESVFRRLSTSLNTMLERIESDNRKLRQTVTELEEVNRELTEKRELVIRSEKLASVGRLSAGLAHEIGNPLSIIQGYVELLSRKDLTEDEKHQFSEKACHELQRIKRLIGQLLDFAGQMKREMTRISLNSIVNEVMLFLGEPLARCSTRVNLEAENDTVMADRDSLHQVLINIFLNALDAMEHIDDREKNLEITTLNETSATLGNIVVLRVIDNGVGIDDKHLAEVFDPFYTTKEIGRGTGLGLYVCHSIIENMGGKITLQSHSPRGTEVRIRIPVLKNQNISPNPDDEQQDTRH